MKALNLPAIICLFLIAFAGSALADNTAFSYIADAPKQNVTAYASYFSNPDYPGLDHVAVCQVLQDHGLYQKNDDGPTNTMTIWYANTVSSWSGMGYGN